MRVPVTTRFPFRFRALALGFALAIGASSAHATVVERVVAVVGEQAILMSEVRERARPFLVRIEQQSPDSAHRAAATSQLFGQLVERLIEEELEQKAANRANIAITPREVEDAIARVAAQNQVTVAQVIEEAAKSGMSEASYRLELRRQLMEAKLLNLRIQGRLRVTEEDVRAAYQALVAEERQKLGFEAAWIRVAAPRTLSARELKTRRGAAERVAQEARAGIDFTALARRYSSDAATRNSGGILGALRPGQLAAPLDSVARRLDVGQISDPIRHGEDFVVLKILSRDKSQLPSYEEARGELSQRVYMEKMGKARRHWIEGLRRQTHVEVRL